MPRSKPAPRKSAGETRTATAASPGVDSGGASPDFASGLAATDFLLAAARAGEPPQNVLLTAEPGTGKRAVALQFAAALLCTGPDSGSVPPCGACRACRLTAAESHPDLHVAPEPLRVESVRELVSRLSLSPSESSYRVALVANVDLATPSAANALLKTVEEPPERAIIVLTAGSTGLVLPTILSRCRVVPVARRPRAEIAARLAECGVEPAKAELAARLSDGRLGWAWSAVNGNFEAERDFWLDQIGAVLALGTAGRLERAAQLARSDGIVAGLSTWRSWARDVLLMSAGHTDGIVATDRAQDLREVAKHLGLRGAAELLAAVESATARVAANANKQLALEALVLELPS